MVRVASYLGAHFMKSLSENLSCKFSSQMRGFAGEMQELSQISNIRVLITIFLDQGSVLYSKSSITYYVVLHSPGH